jgi:hypothetical protein
MIDISNSLITLCKKNPLLRYVTIKEGYQGSEIYIFKYKKYKQPTAEEGFSNNFWYAFITPDETIIVLGSETGRRTINTAHCVTYLEQKNAARFTPPRLFLCSIEGSPAQSYFFLIKLVKRFGFLTKKPSQKNERRFPL